MAPEMDNTERRGRRILYVVHSSSLCGGAPLSLHYLLDGLDRTRYEPIVACIYDAPDVLALFRTQGIRAFYWPGISIFPHTTGGWYSLLNPLGMLGMAQAMGRFWPSVLATERLVRAVKPDIVHLNSLVLASSAVGVKQAQVKLVWHIRESVHPGHFGLRRRWLRALVIHLADGIIFICEQNQQQLMGERKGMLVNELVNFARFDRHLDGLAVREDLGLNPSAKVVLFLGGISQIKGAPVLLAALPQVKQQVPELEAVIAGAIGPQSNSIVAQAARTVLPLVGSGTQRQQFDTLLDKGRMREYVHLLPFRRDPEKLVAAADVVVCPFTQPHFGMPVIEAGAMAKPVVASRIGGLEEAVVDGETGLLVPPNDPNALADALTCVLTDSVLARRLGEGGYRRALEHYNADTNVRQIVEIYERLLNEHE